MTNFHRLVVFCLLLLTLGACAPGASQAVTVVPEPQEAPVVMMGRSAPSVPPELPPEVSTAPTTDPFTAPLPEPVAEEPRYVVHVGIGEDADGNDEHIINTLDRCFQKYHGLTDVEVVFDLDRAPTGAERMAFELEGFEKIETGCAENLFTFLDEDSEYEE